MSEGEQHHEGVKYPDVLTRTGEKTGVCKPRRELQEELGVTLPKDAFDLIFVFLQECVINDGTFINNEFNDVYLVTAFDPIPLEAFTLQLEDGTKSTDGISSVPWHYHSAQFNVFETKRADPIYTDGISFGFCCSESIDFIHYPEII